MVLKFNTYLIFYNILLYNNALLLEGILCFLCKCGRLIYLSIYGSTTLTDLRRFLSFLIYTQSVQPLGRGISPSQGRYLHTEQHKHRIIHASRGIRTRDPRVRAGEDGSCLRPGGHCNRRETDLLHTKLTFPFPVTIIGHLQLLDSNYTEQDLSLKSNKILLN
jgi:hypothetical protein